MNSVDTYDLIFPYLLRKVTEKAALASYDWIGREDDSPVFVQPQQTFTDMVIQFYRPEGK